jgi:hypothetical protein
MSRIKIPKEFLILGLIVLVAFVVRLYRLNYPVADWHSWRQADTASVTREYVKHGIDILHPTYHDLSTIPNNMDNSARGYRMVEFPFINATIAFVLRSLPFLPLVGTSRFFSILASLGTLVSLYFLVRRLSGKRVALLSALVFAVLPYSIFYSRVILPEPYMLFFSTFSLFTFSEWLHTKKIKWIVASGLGLALGLLLKPFVAFLAPAFLGLLITAFPSVSKLKKFILSRNTIILLTFVALSFVPLFFWRRWISQYPEGIPASAWLFNSNGIRFRPAWFRWLGYERLIKLFLGYIGILLLPLAFLKISREKFFYLSWWLGIGLYFSVIATGNVHHDYYQNLMTPILCITVALGAWQLFSLTKKFSDQRIAYSVMAFVLVGMQFFAWQQVKGYFNVNHWEYVDVGEFVDKNTPADAKIIAPALGDTQFLFQTNRTGWPIGTLIEEKIRQGATHYVTTTYDDEARELEKKYTVIEKNDKFLLLSLN